MTDIADKIYAATGLTLGAEAAAKIGRMIQQARRDALEEAIEVLNDYVRCATNDHRAAKTSWDKNNLKGHVKAAKTILAAIRALGEKECKETES